MRLEIVKICSRSPTMLATITQVRQAPRLDILIELADCVRRIFGEQRHIHLLLENDHNASPYLARDASHRPQRYVAQWGEDVWARITAATGVAREIIRPSLRDNNHASRPNPVTRVAVFFCMSG